MQITLNLNKSLKETANEYFDKAKKTKKKIEGAQKTVAKFIKELEALEKKQEVEEELQKVKVKRKRTPEWYEKFRWFFSSEGFLCIGGRDATSNEIVIKKHVEDGDFIFHTEAPGSPFFVVKSKGKAPGKATLQEVANATASFSKAWKLGLAVTDAYYVMPDQVSKKAESGEYVPKGAFMIRGKRTKFQGVMNLCVGLFEDKVMCAPFEAINANCEEFVKIEQGKDKPSSCAKEIAKKLKVDVDEVLRVLPGGTCKVKL